MASSRSLSTGWGWWPGTRGRFPGTRSPSSIRPPPAARRHADAKGVARAASNVGLVEVELGDFDAARRGFVAMLTAAQTLEDERYWGNALANLGMLEIRLGNPSAALPLLAEARLRYARIDYSTGELNALGQLATAWAGLGELQRAIATADSGLALARALGAQVEVSAGLEILADLHARAGNLRLALVRLAEADSLDALLGLVVERGTDLRRASVILLQLGEAAPAVVRATGALEAHRGADARAEQVQDRLHCTRLRRRPATVAAPKRRPTRHWWKRRASRIPPSRATPRWWRRSSRSRPATRRRR